MRTAIWNTDAFLRAVGTGWAEAKKSLRELLNQFYAFYLLLLKSTALFYRFAEKSSKEGLHALQHSRILLSRQADMAQLVEHNLAKVGVAGSSPVVRSIASKRPVEKSAFFFYGGLAKW